MKLTVLLETKQEQYAIALYAHTDPQNSNHLTDWMNILAKEFCCYFFGAKRNLKYLISGEKRENS